MIRKESKRISSYNIGYRYEPINKKNVERVFKIYKPVFMLDWDSDVLSYQVNSLVGFIVRA